MPQYLDIPIKGQQLSCEDRSKNDAIRKFWKNQQETTTEPIATTPTRNVNVKKTKKFTKCTTPPPPWPQNNSKKVKIIRPPSSESINAPESSLKPFDMPDLLPLPNNENKINPKADFKNLKFLTQSIKDISQQGIIKMNFYAPQLDKVATNIDFLFDSEKNSESLALLGNSKRSLPSQIDQTFSEIFCSLPDVNF